MQAHKSRPEKAPQSRAIANQVQRKTGSEILDPLTQLKLLSRGKFQTGGTAQLAEGAGVQQRVTSPAPNRTGMPDRLKTGIEGLSGFDMSDVRVHYNSDKPAQLQAHAYAQGNQIYLGPGQERHLPHEAWHVVQQKQGRVKPTMQVKGPGGDVGVNDDVGLEREADGIGAMALAVPSTQFSSLKTLKVKLNSPAVQLAANTKKLSQLGWLQCRFDPSQKDFMGKHISTDKSSALALSNGRSPKPSFNTVVSKSLLKNRLLKHAKEDYGDETLKTLETTGRLDQRCRVLNSEAEVWTFKKSGTVYVPTTETETPLTTVFYYLDMVPRTTDLNDLIPTFRPYHIETAPGTVDNMIQAGDQQMIDLFSELKYKEDKPDLNKELQPGMKLFGKK